MPPQASEPGYLVFDYLDRSKAPVDRCLMYLLATTYRQKCRAPQTRDNWLKTQHSWEETLKVANPPPIPCIGFHNGMPAACQVPEDSQG